MAERPLRIRYAFEGSNTPEAVTVLNYRAPALTSSVCGNRSAEADPYPATANANTLSAHTITPAIGIRTVWCHMVSIPYLGSC